MIPTAARFEKLMGALGVSNTTRVVFYDQKGLASAARGWWLMRLFGHHQAAVLDGGFPKWVKEGRADRGRPARRAAARALRRRFPGGAGPRHRRREAHRPPGRRRRADPRRPGQGPLRRHRAGTARRPALRPHARRGQRAVQPAAQRRPDHEGQGALHAIFAAAGVDAERPVVTSCGTGVTACILALGLLQAGFPEPAVYDGSWTEWASRPETPKVHRLMPDDAPRRPQLRLLHPDEPCRPRRHACAWLRQSRRAPRLHRALPEFARRGATAPSTGSSSS